MKKFLVFFLIIIMICPVAIAQEIPENAVGVIVVPSLDITMPLYTPEVNEHSYRQKIIDNENSALYVNWGIAYQILDHLFSTDADEKNEWNIQKCFSGAYAYLYTKDSRYYYECYMTGKTEYDGNEYINGRIVTPCSSNDIMLVCCAENTDNHFIAVFRRLKEF